MSATMASATVIPEAATALNLDGNDLIPIACTALISGSVNGVFVLY